MPNRIIRESICKSDSIEQLSWFEEVVFYRLMVNCDDYGRFDARPKILKAALFPLKESVTLTQIQNALHKLSTVNMVQVYEYDRKPYLQLITWETYQNVRNKKSKYPDPPGKTLWEEEKRAGPEEAGQRMEPLANNYEQLPANDVPILSVSESLSVSKYNPALLQPPAEEEQMQSALQASCLPPAITLTLNDKSEYPIEESQVTQWAQLYPAADIMQELRKMKGWLDANPQRRKTKNGILRFITGWLGKEQDKGGNFGKNGPAKEAYKAKPNSFNTYESRHTYDWDAVEKLEAEYLLHQIQNKGTGTDAGS